MDKQTNVYYKQSKKRERFYYDKKASELMYGEEFIKSLKCIPNMSIFGVIKLIPIFVLSQLLAVLVDLSYYFYLGARKVVEIKNPAGVYIADMGWNAGLDNWNKLLDKYLGLAESWDRMIKLEMSIQENMLKNVK